MRFRNKCIHRATGKLTPIHFPYAGEKNGRGRLVGAGELSRELPPDRFFDRLLQRDWKNGAIEVLFNAYDKDVLGEAIQDLVVEEVEVPTEAEAPEPTKVAAPEPDVAPESDAAPEAPATPPDGDATPTDEAPKPKRRRARRKPKSKQDEEPVAPPAIEPPQPVPAPTTVQQPAPNAPPTPPGVGIHNTAKLDPRTQGGIPDLVGLDPRLMAGGPVGLADLKAANDANA